jgi:toxic protein SymE
MPNNTERKLKIVPKYFSRRWKDAVFPEIRLAGKWLQDLGFKCGNFVVITQGENSITITALPEVKEKEPQVVKNYRKAKPIFSPELDAMPGKELFAAFSDEEYHAHLVKKGRRKNPKDQNIIEMPKARQAAEPDTKTIRLHPEPSQAADGTDYFTIA